MKGWKIIEMHLNTLENMFERSLEKCKKNGKKRYRNR